MLICEKGTRSMAIMGGMLMLSIGAIAAEHAGEALQPKAMIGTYYYDG